MAKQKVGFSLVYRDMYQSMCKFQPRVDQLEELAPVIVDMKAFERVETNGGGFEQVQLLAGENPNTAVRKWTKAFNEAGIQTHMLERGLSGIRMYPCSADIRELMFKVKKAQGVDISRSFDGLNDVSNLQLSVEYAKAAGMISQGTITMTHSPFHTLEYYMGQIAKLVEYGAQEIALKDMAGIARPIMIGQIVAGIKKNHPGIKVQYHPQSGPGLCGASILEAVKAGCDIIDVAMEPLSWGMGHADLLSVYGILEGLDVEVPQVDMNAYMKARELTQKFVDEWLGYFIDPKNKLINPLLLGPGLPGGMMGSLMGWINDALKRIKKVEKDLTLNELMVRIFDEVKTIWPMMGYPPLVTPFSQYTVVTAINNVEDMAKGKKRFERIDNQTWDMITGRTGKLPAPVSDEIKELAKERDLEFYEGNPQDLYPASLDEFRKELADNNQEEGQDSEDLFELAMHPDQWRNFKSGKAKQAFEKQLEAKRKEESAASGGSGLSLPAKVTVDVQGQKYEVEIVSGEASSGGGAPAAAAAPAASGGATIGVESIDGTLKEILVKVGDVVSKNQVLCIVEAMKVENEIVAPENGKVASIEEKEGEAVEDGQVIIKLEA